MWSCSCPPPLDHLPSPHTDTYKTLSSSLSQQLRAESFECWQNVLGVCVCVRLLPLLLMSTILPSSQTRVTCSCRCGDSRSGGIGPSTSIVRVDHVPRSVVTTGVMLGNTKYGAALGRWQQECQPQCGRTGSACLRCHFPASLRDEMSENWRPHQGPVMMFWSEGSPCL